MSPLPFVVAIGGPPGSGKSTAGRLVAASLGLAFRSVGEEFRAAAQAHGLDLEAFGRYAEAHPEVDRELDRRMLALAEPGTVLEGRIQGPLLRRAGRAVRSVAVTADRDVRVARLVRRDGRPPAETAERLAVREASERDRYLRFYGIDLETEPVDLTVDASTRTADQVAATIVTYVTAEAARP